jgi:uncharacterized protein YbjT (DUF2867 family)
MRLLVLGSTGVVGGEVIREAAADSRIDRILAISRRPLKDVTPKIQTILHQDFDLLEPIVPALSHVDAAVCALGMAWPQARSEAQYRKVTFDYVVSAARALSRASEGARFCFVSGHGAAIDSRQTWARIKAETEHAVQEIFGERAIVFRPGYIYPAHGRESRYWGDSVMRPFIPFRRSLARWITDSVTVARALLYGALGGAVRSPADNHDITAAAAAYLPEREQTASPSARS